MQVKPDVWSLAKSRVRTRGNLIVADRECR